MTNAMTAAGAAPILKRNAAEFTLGASDIGFAEMLIRGVLDKREEIDQIITKAAPQWPLEKIAPIDRNVLRIGLYELLFGDRKAVPPKVALNEAIEIGKSFGGEQSGKFVNGVLGSVYREIGEPQKHDAPKVETEVPHERLGGAVVVSKHDDVVSVALVHDAFHHWTLPKAKCKEGELTDAAAARAIKEELGVDAPVTDALSEHGYQAHEPKRGTVNRSVAFYLVILPELVPLQCEECEGISEARWYTEDKLTALPIYEDLRAIIDQGIARVRAQ